jgi:uncharacterized Zn-binding protein involved in type VI secretion
VRSTSWTRIALAVALVVAGACAAPASSGEERSIATIEFGAADSVQIVAPATARAGTPFEVRVTTFGGGCVRQGDTEVQVDGLRATITPYDVTVTPEGGACTMELRLYQHAAQVRFDAAGEARLVVRGYSRRLDREITAERTVIVT